MSSLFGSDISVNFIQRLSYISVAKQLLKGISFKEFWIGSSRCLPRIQRRAIYEEVPYLNKNRDHSPQWMTTASLPREDNWDSDTEFYSSRHRLRQRLFCCRIAVSQTDMSRPNNTAIHLSAREPSISDNKALLPVICTFGTMRDGSLSFVSQYFR